MSLPVILQPAAQDEYDEAYDWYDSRQPGLGDDFADQVQDVFNRISANPRIHAVVLKNVRKAVVRVFPYCIYYRELSDRVEVLSVFHTSRDPRVWQSRV